MTRSRSLILIVVVFGKSVLSRAPAAHGQSADSEHPPASRVASAAPDGIRDLAALPQEVLVGTGTQPLGVFLKSRRTLPREGRFFNEQGGGTATIDLRRGTKGVVLVRTFREPGEPVNRKIYSGLRETSNDRLSSTDIEILSVKDGLLILEEKSGVDGIPDSLWVLYQIHGAAG